MKTILVIGAGGIGSVISRELNFLYKTDQINEKVIVADPDNIEIKNVKYQLFEPDEILKNKAQTIANRYNFDYKKTKIGEKELEEIKPKAILICVDNSDTRNKVYKYCMNNECYFIDMRAEGRTLAIFTKHEQNTLDKLQSTLDFSIDNTSCQLKHELEKGIVQRGNFIVAVIASQLLLNYLRGDKNLPEYRFSF